MRTWWQHSGVVGGRSNSWLEKMAAEFRKKEMSGGYFITAVDQRVKELKWSICSLKANAFILIKLVIF